MTINVVINPDEENVFFQLNMYMINNNDLDVLMNLVKYYCDDFNSTKFEGDVVITSCSTEIQTKIADDNDNLILFSIINKDEDICDNRTYIYILFIIK